MSKKYEETKHTEKANRNDDLLEDYLGEMFGTQSTREVVGDDRRSSPPSETNILLPEESDNSDIEQGRTFKPKPARATIERRKEPALREKEFKPADRPVSGVVPALMPKLKPVLEELVVTKDVERPVAEKPVEKTSLVETPRVKEAVAAPAVKPALSSEETKQTPAPEIKSEVDLEDAEREAQGSKASAAVVLESSSQTNDGEVQTKTDGDAGFEHLDEFEALIFDVRGLHLAVPLVSLGSIHRIEQALTPIVGRASWYLGMFRANGRNLQVVDTARWVMPSKAELADTEQYEYVIRLGDSDWALACNSVKQSLTLEQSQIKWRSDKSKRPWLAGTVISHMCALLDVDNMAALLDENKLHVSN